MCLGGDPSHGCSNFHCLFFFNLSGCNSTRTARWHHEVLGRVLVSAFAVHEKKKQLSLCYEAAKNSRRVLAETCGADAVNKQTPLHFGALSWTSVQRINDDRSAGFICVTAIMSPLRKNLFSPQPPLVCLDSWDGAF